MSIIGSVRMIWDSVYRAHDSHACYRVSAQYMCLLLVPLILALNIQGFLRWGQVGDELDTHEESAKVPPYCLFKKVKAAVWPLASVYLSLSFFQWAVASARRTGVTPTGKRRTWHHRVTGMGRACFSGSRWSHIFQGRHCPCQHVTTSKSSPATYWSLGGWLRWEEKARSKSWLLPSLAV